MLPKRHERQARKFAAQAWNEVNSEDLTLSPERRLEIAKLSVSLLQYLDQRARKSCDQNVRAMVGKTHVQRQ
jgi:hypothetical protein